MSTSRFTSRDRSEHAAESVAAAQETLAAEIAALQSGEDWQRFLDLQAKLHAYSPTNCLLIAAQHARTFADRLVDDSDPGFVGGFNLWRALGRGANRGQHGYAILAPCGYDRRVATDEDGHSRRLGNRESALEGERIEVRRVLAGFRVEYVFSVHQTSGVELPEAPRPTVLEGEGPVGLGVAVLEMIEAQGFHVDTVSDSDAIAGANGVTRWDSRVVLVRADMDDAAMVKTLIHEAADVLLHVGPPGQFLQRPLKEVEAESVAFVVASAHGMATGDYSFPYVAMWAGADGAKAIHATQTRVATAARLIIEASPAPHVLGGRPPGSVEVLAAAEARRSELSDRLRADSADSSTGVEL